MRAILLRPADAVPSATAGTLALIAIGLGWRGADWPAQLLRLDLVERDGPALWNNLWFAGHHTPGYGSCSPSWAPCSVATVAIVSCVVAAGSFHVLARASTSAGRWRRACSSPPARW